MVVHIILLYLMILVLPGFLLYQLWRGHEASALEWLLQVSFTGLFLIYVFLAGRWDWASYYLRYAWLLAYVVVAVVSYTRTKGKPIIASNGPRQWLGLASHAFTLLIAVFLTGFAWRDHFTCQQPVRLELPFDDGRYYVAQGGNPQSL